MNSTKKRILVIEDDPLVVALLRNLAAQIPCVFYFEEDPKLGLKRALEERFDVVVLDVMFPENSGLDICREIRARNKVIPILMLTSLSAEVDKVIGLELGADDYLTKPFGDRELAARLRALIRRGENRENLSPSAQSSSPPDLNFGDLRISATQRRVWLGSREIELSALEFDLLFYLASRPGRVCTRDELAENVWGYQASEFDRTITAQFSRLRSKIEPDNNNPRFIFTVKGVGYRFCEAT